MTRPAPACAKRALPPRPVQNIGRVPILVAVNTWSGEAHPPASGRRPQAHLWFLLLPIFTVGLGSFVLPLWAAARTTAAPARARQSHPYSAHPAEPTVDAPRPVLLSLAAGLGAASLLVFILSAAAPTDETGAATGPLAGLSTVLTIGLLAAGVLLALRWRGSLFPPVVSGRIAMLNANLVPQPVAQAQARRSLRQQYRLLALRDPALAREIGVSNFDASLLDEVTEATGVTPAINQIKWSPLLFDAGVLKEHRARGVAVEGYSALRGGTLEHPAIVEIAERLGRTPAQVIIRWHLQHEVVVIPKSVHADRIRSNADVAGFLLSDEDMAALDALGGR